MKGFDPLIELLSHLEYAIYKSCTLLAVNPRYLVLIKMQIRTLNIVINFVPGLILEHLREKLSRRYVCIELLTLRFYCRAV